MWLCNSKKYAPRQSPEELWADLEVLGPKTKAFPATVPMLCVGTLYTMVIQEPETFSKGFYVFKPSKNWNNLKWFYLHFLTWFSLPKTSFPTPGLLIPIYLWGSAKHLPSLPLPHALRSCIHLCISTLRKQDNFLSCCYYWNYYLSLLLTNTGGTLTNTKVEH